MSYVNPNYPSAKAFKAAVKAGIKHQTYNPSGMFETTQNGSDVIEARIIRNPIAGMCK